MENNFGFDIGTGKGKTVKVLPKQRGKTNIPIDRERSALQPGKRKSRTGKTYWETRANRSDISDVKKL